MSKRFMVDDAGTLIDMQTRDMFDIVEEVVDLLNEQHETIQALEKEHTRQENQIKLSYDKINKIQKENEQLKSALKELKEIGDYQADRIQEQNKELQNIKNLIQTSMETERTHIGHNTLKQLWEAIKE